MGGTLDDSLGEAFDKASRLLGNTIILILLILVLILILIGLRTGGSGGAAVELAARSGTVRRDHFSMTIPMQNKLNCDFSYAGLKNSFRVAVQVSLYRNFFLYHYHFQNARQEYGLDIHSTNAPAGQNMEAPERVMLPEAVAGIIILIIIID